MALSPQQRQLLMFGAPVVAVFALVSVLGKRGGAEPAAASSGPPVGYTLPVAPSTDAIGVGQLSQWEDLIGQAITELGTNLSSQIGAIPTPQAPDLTPIVEAINQQQQQPGTTAPMQCTPKFPWHLEGGVLIDNYTGRAAYYGPQSQPAAPYTPGEALPSGWGTWTMPDGRQVKYSPSNWNYADPSRPPVCH